MSEQARLRKRFEQLLLAAADMETVKVGVDLLLRLQNDTELYVAYAGVVVTYARPFTSSNRTFAPLEPLGGRMASVPWLCELHGQLMVMRDKTFAHTERSGKSLRSVVTAEDWGQPDTFLEAREHHPPQFWMNVQVLAEEQRLRIAAEAVAVRAKPLPSE